MYFNGDADADARCGQTLNDSSSHYFLAIACVFEIPQVPFEFEFESEWPNGNSVTKQLPNYHSSNLDKVSQMAKWYLVIQPIFPK